VTTLTEAAPKLATHSSRLMTGKQQDRSLLDRRDWPGMSAMCHVAKDRPLPDDSSDRASGQNAPKGEWL
jgi:hypothetical protein